MAIKLPDGKVARTLPEQVKKNMEDITAIDSEVEVIKESLTSAYKIQGSATVADLNGETIEESMNGYVYNMTDAGSLNNDDGTTTSVQIGDNVVLVWNEGDYFWDRLSGLVDTSDLVTLSTDQTITGIKTFKRQINLNNQNDTLTWDIYLNDNDLMFRQTGTTNRLMLRGSAAYTSHLVPISNNLYDIGSSAAYYKDLYLTDFIQYKNPNVGKYWRIVADSAQNLIIQSSTNGTSWSNEAFWNANGDLNLLSNDLTLAGTLKDTSSNSVTVAQISKTKLYNHKLTISNVAGFVNVILGTNTALSGYVSSNLLSGVMIISAFGVASSRTLYADTTLGLGYYSNGVFQVVAPAAESITDDVVSEY